MKPGERIHLIKTLASRLEVLDDAEIDLTLRQFGLPWSSQWDGGRESYVLTHLEAGNDKTLVELSEYLLSDGGADAETGNVNDPWEGQLFRLFLSHISSEKKFLGEVRDRLSAYGIDGFVAHSTIKPTKEWLEVIDRALRTCEALAAILTTGFKESNWTDQEVGYAIARRVLILPINRGLTPYGFISRYQALDERGKSAAEVAEHIFDVLIRNDLTSAKMAEALVSRLANSRAFRTSIDTMKLLRDHVDTYTPELLRALEEALEKNSQVRAAFGVADFIKQVVGEGSQ